MPKDPAKAQKAKEKKERKALELQMKNSRDKVEEGRLLMEPVEPKAQPQYQKAITAFDQAIEFYNDNFEAFMHRGNAHRELGQPEAAIDDYSRAITLNIQCVPALEGRAACFEVLGQWEAVIRDYTSVIELQPHNDHAFNMRGCARLRKRPQGLRLRNAEFNAVVDDFLKATRLNEHNYHAWCNLGRVYVEHKKFLEGIEAFSKAIALRDDYAYAFYRRGCAAIDLVEYSKKQQAVEEQRARSSGGLNFAAGSGVSAARNAVAASRPANALALALGGGVAPDDEEEEVAAVLPPKCGLLAAVTAAAAPAAGAKPSQATGNAAGTAASPTTTSADELAESIVQREEAQARQAAKTRELLTRAINDFTRVIPADDRMQIEAGAVLNRAVCLFYRSEFPTTPEADATPGLVIKGGDLEFARVEFQLVHDFVAKLKDDSQVLGSITVGVLKEMSEVWLKRSIALIAERKASAKASAGGGAGNLEATASVSFRQQQA